MNEKSVRIDKWLWAARFYKTRSLASAAIKGGKVQFHGNKVKTSKDVQIGDQYTIRQGYIEKTVSVLALSDKRGPAPVAQLLYAETEQSIEKRHQLNDLKISQPAFRKHGTGRPTKRERRHIISFTQGQDLDRKK